MLAEPEFRKLFAVRLVAQGGGGVFNAGFAAYAFFSATTFPNPVSAVEAFVVLYLPYSLIGPFLGVFIDRWSRRQIIFWASMVQAAMVTVASLVVVSGQTQLPFYICVLAILGAGRFFLAALSAATPHVVRPDKLMMANSVAPTCGTIIGFVGGVAGLGLRGALGGSNAGAATTLLVSVVFYVLAGLLALRMGRDTLGPDTLASGHAARAGIGTEIAGIARGLWAALRHLTQRRKAAYALGSVGVHHALYGVLLMQALLLYRNLLYPGGNGDAALHHVTELVAASAIGFGLAARGHLNGHQADEHGCLDHDVARHRRGGDAGPRPDVQRGAVPRPRLPHGAVRAVREDLRRHDRAAGGRRRLHGPGLLAVRHGLQRQLRGRPGDRRSVPARPPASPTAW